jgi:hypothetical protein
MDEPGVVGWQTNVYTSAQVNDILNEARRLECVLHLRQTLMAMAVRKLDSLNSGRMDG